VKWSRAYVFACLLCLAKNAEAGEIAGRIRQLGAPEGRSVLAIARTGAVTLVESSGIVRDLPTVSQGRTLLGRSLVVWDRPQASPGYGDLGVIAHRTQGGVVYPELLSFDNLGQGAFSPLQLLDERGPSVETEPRAITADFDGDGQEELAFARDPGSSGRVVLVSASTTGLEVSELSTFGAGVQAGIVDLEAADLDSDGDRDLAVLTGRIDGTNVVWSLVFLENLGGLEFAAPIWDDFPANLVPKRLVRAELDADGTDDLIVSANRADGFAVENGLLALTATEATWFSVESTDIGSLLDESELVSADFDQDGDDDVAVTFRHLDDLPGEALWNEDTLYVIENRGQGGTWTTRYQRRLGTGDDDVSSMKGNLYGLALGDANRDGRPDLCTLDQVLRIPLLLLGTGAFAFSETGGLEAAHIPTLDESSDVAIVDPYALRSARVRASTTSSAFETHTDAGGRFHVARLPAGTYSVGIGTADDAGVPLQSNPVTVPVSGTVSLRFAAEALRQGGNLVNDASFEMDAGTDFDLSVEDEDATTANAVADGWAYFPFLMGNGFMDHTQHAEGSTAARMTSSLIDGTRFDDRIYQDVRVVRGTKYTVSAQVRSACGGPCRVGISIQCLDAARSVVACAAPTFPHAESATWQRLSFDQLVPTESVEFLRLSLDVASTCPQGQFCYHSSTAWFDDLSVRATSAPPRGHGSKSLLVEQEP